MHLNDLTQLFLRGFTLSLSQASLITIKEFMVLLHLLLN